MKLPMITKSKRGA